MHKYGQYKNDFFRKLNYKFLPNKSILDIGCGDGSDAKIFIDEFSLRVTGIDVFEHEKIKEIKGLDFDVGSMLELPFGNETFDYIFLHDVLHHIDEECQSRSDHILGLCEVRRVVKKSGTIVIVEANRYNPISYLNMVKLHGHNHFTQSYFHSLILSVFPKARFKYFEAHNYPFSLPIWRVYELIMEKIVPKAFLSYNIAIIDAHEFN